MNILQINSFNHGSTGNIMLEIAEAAREKGMNCTTACPEGRSMREVQCRDHLFIGSRIGRNLHIKLAEYTGRNGCFSIVDTLLFLRRIKKQAPDLIHLHNLHNCYINLPLLFRFVRKNRIPLVWTLHDCWAFTGKCPHFSFKGCNKWKTGCHHCSQCEDYPAVKIDLSKKMWKRKKQWFTSVENLTIVTPSQWLSDLVDASFLKDIPHRVIHNGIDLNQFSPTPSDFRKRMGLENKKIVLGVAFDWSQRKGLDVFIALSKRLSENYKIVLVGTNDAIDKGLPANILSIHRTQDPKELAAIYSAADLFVNPTREEVFGLVNVEALACGTPVLCFRTGGCPEAIPDGCGSIVQADDFEALLSELQRICTNRPYSSQHCVESAQKFDKQSCYASYCNLYEEILWKK